MVAARRAAMAGSLVAAGFFGGYFPTVVVSMRNLEEVADARNLSGDSDGSSVKEDS